LILEEENMFQSTRYNYVVLFGILLVTLLVGSMNVSAAVPNDNDVKEVQQSLRDKGYSPGPIDGILGSRTRGALRQYQKDENLPVTGRLDGETAGKLGVEPESVGGSFESAGHEVGKGGKEFGHEMMKGKPVAAGKEMGKGIGRGGQDVGEAVKKAVSTDSDRGDREKKEQSASEK
jgi:peptidoglycan hydrolase-like protein with peptidoglycan-binding domain